jgi:hypothetical protein
LPAGVTATLRTDGRREWVFLMNFNSTPAVLDGKNRIELEPYGVKVILTG